MNILSVPGQVHNGITHNLPGTVIGYVSAPVHLIDGDLLRNRQNMVFYRFSRWSRPAGVLPTARGRW